MGYEGDFEVYLDIDELAGLEEMREDLDHDEPEYIDDIEMSELFW